jgi:hypothetical protein
MRKSLDSRNRIEHMKDKMKQAWKLCAALSLVLLNASSNDLSGIRNASVNDVLADSTPQSVAIYPFTHQHFVCLEHPLGQLKRLGDALGSDCVIVGFGSGAQNADWIGWRASVLAPFNGVVDSVNFNSASNVPGVLGKDRASVIIFRRSDGLRVLFAHVQDIVVKVGDNVNAGQRVARVGNNGPAYFPHTHIGAYKDGEPLQIRFDLAAMGVMPRSESQ